MWYRFKTFWINFFKVVWAVIRSMNSVRGYISLFISYMLYQGWAVLFIILGSLFSHPWLLGIGTTVVLFWVGPGTPVIPLIIVTALFIKRYILFDKSHTVNIKEKWIELNEQSKNSKG